MATDPIDTSFYRAIWRWHFYAGLLVLPFLTLLAVTGAIYLFKPELDAAIYAAWDSVTLREKPAPLSTVIANTEEALSGRVLQIALPEGKDKALRMIVRVASGETQTAFADPYDGKFLGSTSYGGVMQFIRKIHSLQYFGFWASSLMEIAAGWAIVLVATGFYLWWPRGRSGGVVTVRGTPRTRTFWRDVHAVTGAFAGVIILFLALTGMPWSMFWGDAVQNWATAANVNRPAPPAEVVPEWLMSQKMPGAPSHPHEQHELGLPWALQQAPMPDSEDHSHHMGAIGIDTAYEAFDYMGLKRPFSIALPGGPQGAYVATYAPPQVENTRTIYLDQYSAEVLGDVGYKDYGVAAKVIEWGIAVHQGEQFGAVNRYLMLAACLAIVLLAVSAVTMWWKRRPQGSLGAPPVPENKRTMLVVAAIVCTAGIVFPLVGLTIVVALLIEGAMKLSSKNLRFPP